jgi:hypothetical protein
LPRASESQFNASVKNDTAGTSRDRRKLRIRLGFHVQFPAPGYEIMAGCVPQDLDQDIGAGQRNSSNGCWRDSTKVN